MEFQDYTSRGDRMRQRSIDRAGGPKKVDPAVYAALVVLALLLLSMVLGVWGPIVG